MLRAGIEYILTDGYFTRIPPSEFFGGEGGLAGTRHSFVPDVKAVTRVMNALCGPGRFSLLLAGHSHFDHSFDTAAWSRLTGAPIAGSKTTCLQAEAQHIPVKRYTSVYGGEKIAVAGGVVMRVVRWNHSGDHASNPEQHDPVELTAVPHPDTATTGCAAASRRIIPTAGAIAASCSLSTVRRAASAPS